MAFRIGRLVTLVTGGSSGLGRGTVEHFVKNGGRVALVDLPSSNGQEIADTLGADKCIFCPADITNTEDVMNALESTKNAFGGLQAVVNCAGIASAYMVFNFQRNEAHSLDLFEKVMKVNVLGTFNVLRCAFPVLSENEMDAKGQRGVVVNTSSIAAYDGQGGQVAYAASKGAIASMTLPLAREFGRKGVRVATIAPGLFKTPLLEELSEKVIQFLESQIPFPNRLGKPEEFAQLVQAIIENTMINGEVIRAFSSSVGSGGRRGKSGKKDSYDCP